MGQNQDGGGEGQRERERQTSEKKEIQTFREQERMKPRERDDRVRDTKRQNLETERCLAKKRDREGDIDSERETET